MRYFFLSAAALCLIFMAGNAALAVIDRCRYYNSRLERFCLSFMLGIGVIAFVQLYLVTVRLPINRGTIFLSISPFLIVWLYVFIGRGARDRYAHLTMAGLRDYFSRIRDFSMQGRIIEFMPVILLVLLCSIMVAVCFLMPFYAWDGRAIWAFKAKILFHQHTVFTGDFLDITRYHPHQSYPLLLPMVENFFFNVLGATDEYAVKTIFAFLYIVVLGFIYVTQLRYFGTSRMHALFGTAVFACVPCLFVTYSGSVLSGYADFPLACIFTFSVVYLARYTATRRREDMVMAALFSAFSLFTKNEGMCLFALLMAVLFLEYAVWHRFDKKYFRSLGIYLLTIFILVVPWFIVRSYLPRADENNPGSFLHSIKFMEGLSTLPLVLKLTLREMFLNFSTWGLTWYIIVLAFFMSPRGAKPLFAARKADLYLLAIPLSYYCLVITPLYVFYTPHQNPIEIEFQGTSFERFRLHVLPLLVLFVSYRVHVHWGGHTALNGGQSRGGVDHAA